MGIISYRRYLVRYHFLNGFLEADGNAGANLVHNFRSSNSPSQKSPVIALVL